MVTLLAGLKPPKALYEADVNEFAIISLKP
jgi:hypothetical protein